MSFLGMEGRTFLVFGVANRKSVAWAVGQTLENEGANVLYSVRSDERLRSLQKLMGNRRTFVCDVEFPEEIESMAKDLQGEGIELDGILHSIAFANYADGFKPFHETRREDFLQATSVSSFSLVDIARCFKPLLNPDASVVAIGISSTDVTAENYGYMAPIKASLEGCIRYLAKSFSADTEIRFNTVNSGPLKTSASAGIPGYLESYLYSEKLTFRKRGLSTQEVASTAAFLLSNVSSGINGQGITINAGMDFNYFDKDVIRLAMRPDNDPS
ncbi:MAG: SDR family oxidoreductase [Opitutales bacterium]|nr:SDR family oxidoreductase [Opitutales bacterium]